MTLLTRVIALRMESKGHYSRYRKGEHKSLLDGEKRYKGDKKLL